MISPLSDPDFEEEYEDTHEEQDHPIIAAVQARWWAAGVCLTPASSRCRWSAVIRQGTRSLSQGIALLLVVCLILARGSVGIKLCAQRRGIWLSQDIAWRKLERGKGHLMDDANCFMRTREEGWERTTMETCYGSPKGRTKVLNQES